MNVKTIGGYALIGVSGFLLFREALEYSDNKKYTYPDPSNLKRMERNQIMNGAFYASLIVGGVFLLRSK